MCKRLKLIGFALSVTAMMVFAGAILAEDMSNMPGMSHDSKTDSKSESKSVTIKGEVVDIGCYVPEGSTGEDHAACAKMCIQNGNPAGILTSSGKLYVVVGEDDKPPAQVVKGLEAKQVTATGKVIEKGGSIFIVVSKIAEVKTDTPAKSDSKSMEMKDNTKN